LQECGYDLPGLHAALTADPEYAAGAITRGYCIGPKIGIDFRKHDAADSKCSSLVPILWSNLFVVW